MWPPRVAAERALGRVEQVLARQPDDPVALFGRACLLDRLGRAEQGRRAYLDVLARDLTHAGALANLGMLLVAGGYRTAALTVYAQAVAAHPQDPAARVNLANLLRQADRPDESFAQYEAALRLDPDYPEAHQGLSYLLDGTDEPAAARHRALGFTSRVLTTSTYRGEGPPVVVLQLVSARGGNIPTQAILDDRLFLTHTVIAEYADPAALPPHDVVFNAIGDADRCAEALAAAARLVAATSAPVLNPPERILPTARVANMHRLAGVPGLVVPRTVLLPKTACTDVPEGFAVPFLLRSPGFHTGEHFRRVDHVAELSAVAASLPGDTLMALDYLDAGRSDGAIAKYRVMLIDGEILPLHLAISTDWKVHYFTASMASEPAFRDEEARFLADMPAVLGAVAMTALTGLEQALGLDYGGVDFALGADGRLLLFEANATMTILRPPADPIWDYRRPAIDRALGAAQALLRRRGGGRDRTPRPPPP